MHCIQKRYPQNASTLCIKLALRGQNSSGFVTQGLWKASIEIDVIGHVLMPLLPMTSVIASTNSPSTFHMFGKSLAVVGKLLTSLAKPHTSSQMDQPVNAATPPGPSSSQHDLLKSGRKFIHIHQTISSIKGSCWEAINIPSDTADIFPSRATSMALPLVSAVTADFEFTSRYQR